MNTPENKKTPVFYSIVPLGIIQPLPSFQKSPFLLKLIYNYTPLWPQIIIVLTILDQGH